LTAVQFPVGDWEVKDDWVTGEHQINTHQRSPAALELAERQLRSVLDSPTPALFLTAVQSHVGGMEPLANWVTGEHQINTHQRSPAALELAERQLRSVLDTPTPVPFLTTLP
jgi:hypothetical protein